MGGPPSTGVDTPMHHNELASDLIGHSKQLPKTSDKPQLLSVKSASQMLGVCLATVWNMIASGEIHSVKIRDRRLIPVSEIHRLSAAGTKLDAVKATRSRLAASEGARIARGPSSQKHQRS
mgnify:CR=1 FL=1